MKLILGLGNTGTKYSDTPHNAGFVALDMLKAELERKGFTCTAWTLKKSDESEVSEIFNEKGMRVAALAKPQTFMNLSGRAAQKLLKTYSIKDRSDIMVVYDELDIRLGEFKFSPVKNSRTHNGINSIITSIGNGFTSLRIGCDNRSSRQISGLDYVLKRYSAKETETLKFAITESINLHVISFLGLL